MQLNLFCFIIFSINTLTITSNFVHASALSYDNDVEVIKAHETVKRNITQVPEDEEPEYEEYEYDEEEEKKVAEELLPGGKRNITQVPEDEEPEYEEPEYEEPEYEEYKYDEEEEKKVAEELLPGVKFPRELFDVDFDDPCDPSPCGRMNFWHWGDQFNGKIRHICLPNYVRSPTKCDPKCPVQRPGGCHEVNLTPCSPSPCGLHSQCREADYQPICSCKIDYMGTPPNCRRECTINSECASDKACINRKCVDPCVYKCARNANCTVIAHNPICSCQDAVAGDPFTNCMPLSTPSQRPEFNPCIPSLCGPHSQCQEFNGSARCSCLPNYISSPPRCRLECTIDSDCNTDKVCINNKCIDPCPTACGNYAECTVHKHVPYCTCLPDSCQELDQTFDFPRYPELDHNITESQPKKTGSTVIPFWCHVCDASIILAGCVPGTVRFNDLCVPVDYDDMNNN